MDAKTNTKYRGDHATRARLYKKLATTLFIPVKCDSDFTSFMLNS